MEKECLSHKVEIIEHFEIVLISKGQRSNSKNSRKIDEYKVNGEKKTLAFK